ncbi:receptor like protein 30-like [Durio zibethinus]|uniref:Receptor like protein 30-like n=1 Tax=Durio zibethinus TaxID=66656 RepID=A0A6P5Y2H6_DURZI|nr:receptor like protein 30-like [Durio zibethinus]
MGEYQKKYNFSNHSKVLNLSQNSFSGQIPLALENLKDLESLDLSQNKLSGKIPPQLTSLTFLEALNLSYNQLEGSIPQSNQFNTFSNDSYKGNLRLCGPPLSRKCNEVGVPVPLPKKDVDSLVDGISVWKIALIGYGSGLVIGLCMGYTVLNEFGNIWLDKFKKKGKRNKRSIKIHVNGLRRYKGRQAAVCYLFHGKESMDCQDASQVNDFSPSTSSPCMRGHRQRCLK